MKTILAVAHDPGGATALRPVLDVLYRRRDRCLAILAQSSAVEEFEETGLPVVDCGQNSPHFSQLYEWAASQLLNYKPDLLLTATGGRASFERAFIRASRKLGIKCITVLDSWTNYSRRLLEPGESKLTRSVLPDIVTAIDKFAAAEMQKEGFPAEIIRVIGQPALDEILRWSRQPEVQKCRQFVREHYQLSPDTPLVVFFSQPIAEMYPPASMSYRGYTEHKVLADVLQALSELDPQPFLIVKTHPKEDQEKFTKLHYQSTLPLTIAKEVATEALIQATDMVIGMTSIVMVKSFLLMKNVISYQPKLIGQDALVISRLGLIKTIKEREGLVAALSETRVDDLRSELPDTWIDGRAADRLLEVIESIL